MKWVILFPTMDPKTGKSFGDLALLVPECCEGIARLEMAKLQADKVTQNKG